MSVPEPDLETKVETILTARQLGRDREEVARANRQEQWQEFIHDPRVELWQKVFLRNETDGYKFTLSVENNQWNWKEFVATPSVCRWNYRTALTGGFWSETDYITLTEFIEAVEAELERRYEEAKTYLST